jgi:hypothetical protein
MMEPLTIENASNLDYGEIYRIGIHDHNLWERFIVFDDINQYEYDMGQADLYQHLLESGELKQKPNQYPISKHVESLRKLWLWGWQGSSMGEAIDKVGYGEKPTRIAYEIDSSSKQIHDGCEQSYFCSGSGAEPLWILEDGETCEDIPRARIKSIEEMREAEG